MEKTKQNKIMNIMLIIAIVLAITAILMIIPINSGKTGKSQGNHSSNTNTTGTQDSSGIKVTFIELGSVRCIPCKMMQPVMKAIGKKYPDTVKVVFYDVWTDEGKPYGASYNIKAIPTQVFLDGNGVEYFRHEGFFPQEELEKILKIKL